MAWTDEQLNRIFDRTSGCCHICWKKLVRSNYSRFGLAGAWEVEHSIPRAEGGTDHGNNLFPAHITCNRAKGTLSSRTARRRHGRARAPLSRAQRERRKEENTVKGGVLGVVFGLATGGIGAAIVLGIFGSALGSTIEVGP